MRKELISPEGADVCVARAERIRRATSAIFDVVIVGGGIHGVCVAKLAAKAGLTTLLFEKSDYAGETSSRSSKMAHGGLRYLEMFDFQQVFEGIKAREELFTRCPNLVVPEKFLIPIARGDVFSRIKLGIGLHLYDLMVRNSGRRHRWIPRRDLAFTSFNPGRTDLMGCFQYTDGLMNDSRLVIELLVSAQQHGACALNYAKINQIVQDAVGEMRVEWSDCLSGQPHTTRCKVVVNCAGPWAPFIRESQDASQVPPVKYSRGSHLLFSVPWRDPSLFLPLEEKGRYYFVWPHPTGTMVGTTEREVADIECDPQPSQDEVDEILQRLKRDLPTAGLNRSTLHYAFSGVRTLPLRDSHKGVSQLSRKHTWKWSKGVLTLLGGKYTTFAWTASEGAALLLHHLGIHEGEVPSAFDDLPSSLVGSDFETIQREVQERAHRSGPAVDRAIRRLGHAVLHYIERNEAWNEIAPGVLTLEVMHAIEIEQAETLEDIMRRRVDLEFTRTHGVEALAAIESQLALKVVPDALQKQRDAWLSRLQRLHSLLGLPSIESSCA